MAIYAVDFDGTLAVTRFPEIVEPKQKVVAAVKMLKANGHKVYADFYIDDKAMSVSELEAIMDKVVDIVGEYVNQ